LKPDKIILPYFPPEFPIKKQMRESDRREGKTNILTCLICNKEFNDLDKKHDSDELSSCYCSFQCKGKSLDNLYDEIQARKSHNLSNVREK
jgi:hypothetical protein